MKVRRKFGSVTTIFLICIFLYALFASSSIKSIWAISIDGAYVNNIIYFYPIVLFLAFYRNTRNITGYRAKVFIPYIIMILLNVIACVIHDGGCQSVIGTVFSFVPMLLIFTFSVKQAHDFYLAMRVICLVSLLYAIITLFVSLTGEATTSLQARIRMPIGSTITVSYFFVLVIPVIFLLLCNSRNKMSFFYVVTLFVAVAAVISQVSRMAVLSMVVEILLCVLLVKGIKKTKIKWLLWGIVAVTLVVYVIINYFDISRLFVFANNASLSARKEAADFAINIFKDHWLLGTGTGVFFSRSWSERYISYGGSVGLVDPHNLYAMILSELGVVGSLLLSFIVVILVQEIKKIKNKEIRNTGIIILISVGLCSLGGSQIFNEPSFATVFWLVLMLFVNRGYYDSRV